MLFLQHNSIMEQDFNVFKARILENIKSGKSLFGKEGALVPMIESIVNTALTGEMDAHLTRESRDSGNRRNGKMQKRVQTPMNSRPGMLNAIRSEERQLAVQNRRCTNKAEAPLSHIELLNVTKY